MRRRVLVVTLLAGLIAVGAWGRASSEPQKDESVSLRIEAVSKGKLRVIQSIEGRKPLVVEIEARDEGIEVKYGDDTTISAESIQFEFKDGHPDSMTAKGKGRMIVGKFDMTWSKETNAKFLDPIGTTPKTPDKPR